MDTGTICARLADFFRVYGDRIEETSLKLIAFSLDNRAPTRASILTRISGGPKCCIAAYAGLR